MASQEYAILESGNRGPMRTIGRYANGARSGMSEPTSRDQRRPNIIYILADDLGYGDLGCYGQQRIQTPNLDRMASEGIRFTQHYAGSAICAPSRCSLMTGLHTGHAVIRGNKEINPEGQYPLPAGTVTIATLLQRAGYATGAFGKWGLGYPASTGDPLNQGFDEFFGYNCQRRAHNYYPRYLWHNKVRVRLNDNTYSHDLIVDRARRFIGDNQNRPFFCYLPVTIPHASLHVPEDSSRPYRARFPQFNMRIVEYAGRPVRNPAACYAGMITRLDSQVGDILSLLEELGIDRSTIVMFASDNGPSREGGAMPGFFNSNGPLRGLKRDLFEGGTRVPFIARWPATITAGSVADHVSALWDVMPTLCEISHVRQPKEIDGLSFLPTLLGNTADQQQHPYLYWELRQRGGLQAIRMGDWKALRARVSRHPLSPIRLCRLSVDLAEAKNVARQHPEQVSRILPLFESARVESRVFRLFGRQAP
jgi:arylsulfatase A